MKKNELPKIMVMEKLNLINNDEDIVKSDFNKDELLKVLRFMLLARSIDNKALNLLRQGKTFFHIAGAGHEAIQVAIGLSLNPKEDWFFPYYRDLALVLTLGMTPKEFFMQCFGKLGDPSCGGRQLPCHWGHTEINIPISIKSNRHTIFKCCRNGLGFCKNWKEKYYLCQQR